MVPQQRGQAGDVVERVEVVHSVMQPVHAVLVARRARQQRRAAADRKNIFINRLFGNALVEHIT